ncbi:MAG: hypothetical protein ABI210_12195, partial [Abditibacteriaceae bacterium]
MNPKQFSLMFLSLFILILTTSDISFADSAKPDIPQHEQIKKILATADSVRVEIISVYCTGPGDVIGTSCGEEDTFVTNLKPDKILTIVKDFKLTAETSKYGTGDVPDISFTFYKKGKRLTPYLMIGYGNTFANYCYYPFTPKIFARSFDDATTRRFRQMILQEPLIVKKLKEIGGKDINLDPGYKAK